MDRFVTTGIVLLLCRSLVIGQDNFDPIDIIDTPTPPPAPLPDGIPEPLPDGIPEPLPDGIPTPLPDSLPAPVDDEDVDVPPPIPFGVS